MSVIINPIITNAGLNVFTPLATGIEFTFTHVAVGTGTSAVDANDTALQTEIARFPIAGGGVIAGGKAVSINALVTNHANANPQDYNISEVGFYGLDSNNNTVLFAIQRQSTTIVRKVSGADIALPFVLGLSALPVENMTVTIDTNTSGALALLGQHVANAHPHTQYKRTLDNTEQLKILDGTDNDHAASKGQLDGAISTEATARSNADTALQNSKADLAGSSTQTFSVATATANDHAVRKEQLDAKTGIATDTIAGIVEKATQAEMNAGTANVWPDAATLFNGYVQSGTTNGYIKLPEWLGGIIVQWGEGSPDPASDTEPTQSISFSPWFTTLFQVYVSTSVGSADSLCDAWYQTYNLSATGFNVKRQISIASTISTITTPRWLAIGK